MISGWPFKNIDVLFTRESFDGTLDSANKRSAIGMLSNKKCTLMGAFDIPLNTTKSSYKEVLLIILLVFTYTRGLFDIFPN